MLGFAYVQQASLGHSPTTRSLHSDQLAGSLLGWRLGEAVGVAVGIAVGGLMGLVVGILVGLAVGFDAVAFIVGSVQVRAQDSDHRALL